MKTRKVVLLTMVCAFAALLSISLAQASPATVATLRTTDISGDDKIQFDQGETVYIRWTANGIVNIIAKFEDDTIDDQWLNRPSSGVIEYTPSKGSGFYVIQCTGSSDKIIAYGTILVVPEVPFGTIMAVVASFGAFAGLVTTRRLRLK